MNDLVLITSVINTGVQPWSYTPTRSVYTPDERFNQTLDTIKSIRTYFPSAKILLVESSEIPEEFTKTLIEKTDYFLNINNDEYARKACLESNMKGYGEGVQTRFAIEYIVQHTISFNRLFKISGRYFLTDKFKLENFSTDKFTFKRRVDTHDGRVVISTVLYSVPQTLLEYFYKAICYVIQCYETRGERGYEEALPILCEPREEIETTGAGGLIAVVKDEIIYT